MQRPDQMILQLMALYYSSHRPPILSWLATLSCTTTGGSLLMWCLLYVDILQPSNFVPDWDSVV